MNKRQAKKYRRKIVYPFMDEANLLTLTKEEREEALKELDDFCVKYRHYHHYRDKKRIMDKPCCYRFPLGSLVTTEKDFLERIYRTARKYKTQQ